MAGGTASVFMARKKPDSLLLWGAGMVHPAYFPNDADAHAVQRCLQRQGTALANMRQTEKAPHAPPASTSLPATGEQQYGQD